MVSTGPAAVSSQSDSMSKAYPKQSAEGIATAPRPPTPVLNHAHLSPPPSPTIPPDLGSLHINDRHPESSSASHQHLPEDATLPVRTDTDEIRFSGKEKGKGKALDGAVIAELGREGVVEELYYRPYRSEDEDLGELMRLVESELSEPYNIYTFRYFLIEWPHLAFMVYPSSQHKIPIGTIVCKQDQHRNRTNRGYIAMLSVDRKWRRRGIGDLLLLHTVERRVADSAASKLIRLAIDEMTRRGAHEIVLETECDNSTSLALYESLGFMREKALERFYSNGKDAYRLLLALPNHPYLQEESAEEAENARWEVGQGPYWLEDLDEDTAYMRGLGGPAIGDWGEPKPGERAGTPRPGDWPGSERGSREGTGRDGWKPNLPPRPSEWDGMYT